VRQSWRERTQGEENNGRKHSRIEEIGQSSTQKLILIMAYVWIMISAQTDGFINLRVEASKYVRQLAKLASHCVSTMGGRSFSGGESIAQRRNGLVIISLAEWKRWSILS
jgi:hypothetical protein